MNLFEQVFEHAFFSQSDDLAFDFLIHRFAYRDVHRRPECSLTVRYERKFAAFWIALLIGQDAS